MWLILFFIFKNGEKPLKMTKALFFSFSEIKFATKKKKKKKKLIIVHQNL
jgi:hypothetical protein